LAGILPAAHAWCPDLSCWGAGTRHDIQVWREDEAIESIEIRIDVREPITALLYHIARAAVTLEAMVYLPNVDRLVEPNVFSLRRAIMEIPIAHYCQRSSVAMTERDNP
jgi:hypothetical protein